MTKQKEKISFKGIKALNIRDYENNPNHRKAMGYFKHMAYTKGISQADMLLEMSRVYFHYKKNKLKKEASNG